MSEINQIKQFGNKINNPDAFSRIIFTIILLLNILIFSGFSPSYITNFVCIFYPAYLTLKNIELENNDKNNKWITYWIIFALFSLLDNFDRFIPYYFFLKYNFLIWCFIPYTEGSVLIYNRIFYNFINKLEKEQDTLNNRSPVSEFSKTSRKVSEMQFTQN